MPTAKINDLSAASAVTDSMQLEVDTTGTTSEKVTALQLKNYSTDPLKLLEENAQTGTSYTLVLADAFKGVTMNNADANTVTIPDDVFPIGTQIIIHQIGVGVTTITGDTGVIVNGVSEGSVEISSQWAAVTLWQRDTDVWSAIGGIS